MNLNDQSVAAQVTIRVFMIIAIFLCLAPFVHIFALSLSSNSAILSGKVSLLPVDFNLNAYKQVLGDASMIRSLLYSIVLTVSYTLFALLMTIAAAFPLSKDKLKGRKQMMVLIIVTMFFSGGPIPEYMLVKELGLTNTMWSLILPILINPFFLMIMITFFRAIPTALLEASEMDGAGHLRSLVQVVLPLSLPVMATIGLFYAVGRWNGFMDSLYYITDPKQFPIQLKLYQIVQNSMTNDTTITEGTQYIKILPESIKSASIMLATVPILLVYPWLQRYFIAGSQVGAIKE